LPPHLAVVDEPLVPLFDEFTNAPKANDKAGSQAKFRADDLRQADIDFLITEGNFGSTGAITILKMPMDDLDQFLKTVPD